MMLTIYTLFNDPNIVNAVIQRVLQTRKDTIYWQQYLDFRRTTTRVFKDYIGQVTGVMAGSWAIAPRFPSIVCLNFKT